MISRQQSRQQSNLLCARSSRWMRHRAGFPRHNRTLRLENFKQTKNWITALVIWNTLKNIHGENTFLTGVSLGTSLVANWQDFCGIRWHTSSGICGQLDMVGLATTQRVKPVSVTQRHRRGTVEAPLGICTRHRRVSEGVGHTWVVQTLEHFVILPIFKIVILTWFLRLDSHFLEALAGTFVIATAIIIMCSAKYQSNDSYHYTLFSIGHHLVEQEVSNTAAHTWLRLWWWWRQWHDDNVHVISNCVIVMFCQWWQCWWWGEGWFHLGPLPVTNLFHWCVALPYCFICCLKSSLIF